MFFFSLESAFVESKWNSLYVQLIRASYEAIVSKQVDTNVTADSTSPKDVLVLRAVSSQVPGLSKYVQPMSTSHVQSMTTFMS